MSTLSCNIAALDVAEKLNVKLASGWSEELLHDVATVCYTNHQYELGFIVTLIVEDDKTSYSVSEYAAQRDEEFEDIHNVYTLEEALSRIRERADVWMNGPDNF